VPGESTEMDKVGSPGIIEDGDFTLANNDVILEKAIRFYCFFKNA
jgi:hypothetical protein